MAKRPGGLTALAVLNFVFAGISLLGVLAMLVVFRMADSLKTNAHSPQDRFALEALEHMNTGLWVLIVASSVIATALLIVAGVGYLKMRRWGRRAGSAYAVTAIASAVLGVMVIPDELGGGFNIGTVLNLVYPLLTLFFVNVTFKDDLS